MKKKKILTLCLAAALAVSPMAVFADGLNEENPGEAGTGITEPIQQASYVEHTVTVKSIEENDDSTYITAEDENGGPIDIHVPNEFEAAFDNAGEKIDVDSIQEGDSVTIYLQGNKPAILIYPPRYTPDVLILNKEESVSKVSVDNYVKNGDREDSLINSSRTLVLNIGDDMEIVDLEGNKVAANELDGKDLCVFYTITTFSLPPQTPPEKIVVLGETKADDDQDDADDQVEVTGTILANGKEIKADVVSVNGTQMLPVRAISEALGLDVHWDDELQAVSIGTVQMGVTFKIGIDSYSKAKMTPAVLGQAPVTVIADDTGVTYVPVKFFTDILSADVTAEDGKTIITLQ